MTNTLNETEKVKTALNTITIGSRVVNFTYDEKDNFIWANEECDYYFGVKLDKNDMNYLIQELIRLRDLIK